MRLLKFFLYTVLFIAIGWSFLIFGGPSILTWAVASYSDGRVSLKNVEISPRLQITIGRVEFDFGDKSAQTGLFGLSRSVKVDWSIFDDNALATLTTGLTEVNNLARAESLQIEMPAYQELNLNDLSFAISANAVELEDLLNIESFKMSGSLKNNFHLLADTDILVSDLETFDPVVSFFNSTNARISDVKLDVPLADQEIVTDLFVNQASISKVDATAEKIKSTVTLINGDFDFDVDFDAVLIKTLNGELKDIKASGKYGNGGFINPLVINMSGGTFIDNDVKLARLDAEILNINKNMYSANAQLEFSSIRIDTADTYIGELPANNIKFDVVFDALTNQVVVRSRIEFEDPDLAKISGLASSTAELGQSKNNPDCDLTTCYFKNFVSNYQVNFGEDNFIGKSSCSNFNCDLESMSHNLVTSNTAKVFEILQSSKVFNPILSIYLYGAISAGKKIGKGHKVIIN